VSEVGEAQRGQVQVKWKPDWRWCWRVERGSRGEVSVGCQLVGYGRRGVRSVHEIVISSPAGMGRVACTVCERRSASIMYCAL
jgi:hypothetical protein